MITRWRRQVGETLRWWRRAKPNRSAAAVRAVATLGAVACVVLLPGGFLTGLAAAAAVVALITPARVGAGPFVVLCILSWAFGHGRAESVAVIHTVAFALLLYATHQTVALAAAVPIDTQLTRGAVQHWLRASLPAALAVPVTAAGVAVLGRPGGSAAWDVVGLGGGLVVLAGLVWAVWSGPRDQSPST